MMMSEGDPPSPALQSLQTYSSIPLEETYWLGSPWEPSQLGFGAFVA